MVTVTLGDLDAHLQEVKDKATYLSKLPADFLQRLPFGKQLEALAYDSSRPEYDREHVMKVLFNANLLLADGPARLVQDPCDDAVRLQLESLLTRLRKLRVGQRPGVGPLLRAAVLYHDIGKYIIKDRHPIEGYFLLKFLSPKDGERLDELFGRETSAMLRAVIRDHDKFGNLSTGEASLPVMADLLNPAAPDTESYRIAILFLFFVNLADIAASASGGLCDPEVKWLVDDVQLLLEHLDAAGGARGELTRRLAEVDASPERTAQRIARLVYCSYRHGRGEQSKRPEKLRKWKDAHPGVPPPGRAKDPDWRWRKSEWPDIEYARILVEVETQMQEVFLGHEYYRFCADFSHFCRFEYTKPFLGEVARQFNVARIESNAQDLDLKNLVVTVLHILRSIVDTYRELGEDRYGSVSRVGVQMQALARDNVKETIAKLLAGRGAGQMNTDEIISWVTHEVSVWLLL